MTTTPIKILIIDDDQDRIDQFIRNNPNCQIDYSLYLEGAFDRFDTSTYDLISLDHDLGISYGNIPMDIIPFVKYLRQAHEDGRGGNFQILVHSANPVGSANILSYFSRTPVICDKIHFAWRIPNLFDTLVNRD